MQNLNKEGHLSLLMPDALMSDLGATGIRHLIFEKNEYIDKIKVDASITAKPFFEKFGFKQIKENLVKRENIELVNFSMEMNLKT